MLKAFILIGTPKWLVSLKTQIKFVIWDNNSQLKNYAAKKITVKITNVLLIHNINAEFSKKDDTITTNI